MTASEQAAVSSKRAGDKPVLGRLFVFSGVLVTVLLLTQSVTQAQQPTKIPRIGFLPSEGDASNPGTQIKAFQRALRHLGYIEGKNILVEYRYGEGQAERIPSLVAELVQIKLMCSSLDLPVPFKKLKKQVK
jgi:hypothetical protein